MLEAKFGEPGPELMGLREYARHRAAKGLNGGTLAAVQRAIASGRIAVVMVGQSKKIDAKEADLAWAANTMEKETPVDAGAAGQRAIPGMEAVIRESGVAEVRPNGYHKSREVREMYNAALTKLDFEERSGKLVSAEEIYSKYFSAARGIRNAILGIPARVGAILAATKSEHEVIRILNDELKRTLTSLADDIAAESGGDSAVVGPPAGPDIDGLAVGRPV